MQGDSATSDIYGTTPDKSARTIAQMCADAGLPPDNVRVTWNRAKSSGTVSRPYSQGNVPTVEEVQAVAPLRKMIGQAKNKHKAAPKKTALPIERVKAVHGESGVRRNEDEGAHPAPPAVVAPTVVVAAAKPDSLAEWPTWCIMLGATAVTVQSMLLVTGKIFDDDFNSLTFTGLLSAIPIFISFQKKVDIHARAIVWVLIGFELFCNTTRLYAGLLNFNTPSVKGEPTEFLAMVMEMLGTGKAATAFVLSFALAVIAAAIFSMAFRAINKGK